MFFKSRKESASPEPTTRSTKPVESQAERPADPVLAPTAVEESDVDPTVEGNTADQSAAATNAAQDMMRRGAAASKHLQASFGQLVSLLMRTQTFRAVPLARLETAVLPAIVTGQFVIAEKHSEKNGFSTPVAAVTWANVSPEVDARLSGDINQLVELSRDDWKSGETVWIITAVGDQTILKGMIEQLRKTVLKGRSVKLYTNDSGSSRQTTLEPM